MWGDRTVASATEERLGIFIEEGVVSPTLRTAIGRNRIENLEGHRLYRERLEVRHRFLRFFLFLLVFIGCPRWKAGHHLQR